MRNAARVEARAAYAFVAPTALLLGLFVFLPLAWAVVISLQRTDGFGQGAWIGLDNYARLLGDGRFWRATANTLVFTVVVTPLSIAFGLAAALLLNSALPARPLFRTVLILPMAVSGVATALIGLLFFDENTGVLNSVLASLGLSEPAWQSDGPWAFGSVVLVTLWWRVGFNMLIYLTALQGTDPQLHESAMLDGASWGQRLRHVTVPQLRPATFFLVIINVIYSFQVFDLVFVLTGGGPQDATSVLVTYAYEQGFTQRDQGYAAAVGMVLLVATLAFTAIQWRLNHGRDGD
ncbi:multiple sugar transport system permease protein [Nocardioides exalbidus]|uniref:Multiple sugar transport system permease protein n=1 Tax=Nocardioides exalbidus TaxID=402596 RepID=A0A1H4WPP4_9ACTN|nr:sugar ABC transporter permease [Nocardioides exalbidus]SEC94581.1 multiple sugar transport system permease protein [Nocardioides exalbidus]